VSLVTAVDISVHKCILSVYTYVYVIFCFFLIFFYFIIETVPKYPHV
jgi:hypothetical protein